MTLFLTASSFYRIFTQVPKIFNSTVALKVGFICMYICILFLDSIRFWVTLVSLIPAF